ncbi:unnamed protein product [Brassicogethes aeneus]|uniref:GPI transamidase component PIG-S n=1 Tax=Brassicogethes aeneus TaxID=1431903 RepID=A0A9P0B6W7_BRAAE|nr:unnamed protein product [Brassicogethes aeneus]
MSLITEPKKSDTKKTSDEDDPECVWRIYSVLSYFIVLVIIGLPIWWYTTRVYRASLPLDEMFDITLKNTTDKEYGIPLSLEYDVLISIVNPEPSSLKIDLKGQDMEDYLQPFLSKLSPIADFTVKSQWLYHVELGAVPRKMYDHFAIMEEQLPHIISPLEKKLWSHLSPRPCLNLVLYFPQCRAPLHIYNMKNERLITNAMLSPRWGGIYILNSDKPSCEAKVFKPDIEEIVNTFIAQLQILFKIKGTSKDDVYELKLRKTQDMLESTKRTLKSLAQLLSEINSIVISDDVAQKINVAVENKDLTEKYLNEDNIDLALKHAKIAFEKSEEAFSDPSLLALLYFPDDQKYAVYIPLFLPVMIPVLMSLITIRKWFFNRGIDVKVKSE